MRKVEDGFYEHTPEEIAAMERRELARKAIVDLKVKGRPRTLDELFDRLEQIEKYLGL